MTIFSCCNGFFIFEGAIFLSDVRQAVSVVRATLRSRLTYDIFHMCGDEYAAPVLQLRKGHKI